MAIPGIGARLLLNVMIALTVIPQLSLLYASEEEQPIRVIQERLYNQNHEISIEGGYVPSEFFENFPVGVAYLYHFNNHFAWEVVRAESVINKEKSIIKRLEDDFLAEPEDFVKTTRMIQTGIYLKPTYGKDSFFNNKIINHESNLGIGVGIATQETQFPESESTSDNVLLLSLRAGRKYFLNRNFSLSFFIKNMTFFEEEETKNRIYTGVGLSFRFDFGGKELSELEETDPVYDYLREGDTRDRESK